MSDTGLFSKLKAGLGKTRSGLIGNVKKIFTGADAVTDSMFDALEEILISADVGVETTLQIIEDMRARAKAERISDPQQLYQILKDEMIVLFGAIESSTVWKNEDGPHASA